jgi:hypothetical protein
MRSLNKKERDLAHDLTSTNITNQEGFATSGFISFDAVDVSKLGMYLVENEEDEERAV